MTGEPTPSHRPSTQTSTGDHRAVPGSERRLVGDVQGAADATQTAQVTVVLRRRAELPSPASNETAPRLTSAELAERHGADADDLARVQKVLTDAGLTVVSADAATRLVRVEGDVATLQKVFGVSLQQASIAGDTFRVRDGSVHVPAEIADAVVAVLGLDNRPQAHTRLVHVRPAAAAGTSYTPVQLAEIYQMPDGDGAGQTIAIIELGGGFGQSDLEQYFGELGLSTPTVTAVGVDGATNVAGKDPQGADGEVLLDIEVAGAIAPAATVLVYFAPNTDAGFLDAVSQAAHATPTPAAMSISWGESEDQWTQQARDAMDAAFADAVALGCVVTAAAGDNGSGDNDTSTASGATVHADFPASSPHALACGGTNLKASGTSVTSETVWNDGGQGGATGGGVSDAFDLPSWQATAGVPKRKGTSTSGRGVPDIAAVADPETGYQVYVDGQSMVIGGTSAVAPLWAGLVARVAQAKGSLLGDVHPLLYAHAAKGKATTGLRDITHGSNGAYSAHSGWDACTGLGVPDAGTAALLQGGSTTGSQA